MSNTEAAEIHKSTGRAHQGMRLAKGISDESARRSLMRGRLPSTLPVPAREKKPTRGCDDKMADKRSARAEVHAAREGARTARARQHASKRTKVAASELHWPPTSMPRTVRWQHREATSSEYARILGSTGNLEGCPGSVAAEAARSTRGGGERCDEGGVNRDLGPIPKKGAVGNDLYWALVWPPRLDVQVSKEDVLPRSCVVARQNEDQ